MSNAHVDQLSRNNEIRNKLINTLAEDAMLPADKDKQTVLLKALSDSDKSAFNSQRISIEERNADSAAEQAKAFSNISEQISAGQANPFRRRGAMGEDTIPTVKESGQFNIPETAANMTPSGQTSQQFLERRKKEEQEALAKKKAEKS